VEDSLEVLVSECKLGLVKLHLDREALIADLFAQVIALNVVLACEVELAPILNHNLHESFLVLAAAADA